MKTQTTKNTTEERAAPQSSPWREEVRALIVRRVNQGPAFDVHSVVADRLNFQ